MKIFYGTAIQGSRDKEQRTEINRFIIGLIKNLGHDVVSEHTKGLTLEDRWKLLEKDIGPLPPEGIGRTVYIRDKLIGVIEGDTDAAIFEVSEPSLGTGIEIAHAYLRPRMGLKEIPILVLYQKDYWPNKLSSMIRGISKQSFHNLEILEYNNLDDVKHIISRFLD